LSALANGRRTTFLLSGMLTGAAVGVKFSALGIVASPLVAVMMIGMLLRSRRTGLTLWLGGVAAFCAGLALAYGPWLGRAWWRFGHPLHPFAGEAPGWTTQQAAFLLEQHRPLAALSSDHLNRV